MSDNTIVQPGSPALVGGGGGGGAGDLQPAAPVSTEPLAATGATDPAAPANPSPPEPAAPKTPDEYEAMIKELRKENAGWRTKLRDAEPIIKAHNAAEEAAKTEVQRATERATAAEKQIAELTVKLVAARHGIPEEDYDLLGSGTPEELENRAARLAARRPASAPPPPPSDRPVEGLRPGASPTPPAQPDTSYPAAWKP
ncbi:hypothetical protein ACW9HF_15120 [Nocardia gipuzkoensis]